jgi:hypothetical protein
MRKDTAKRDEFKDILKFNEKAMKELWDNEEDEIWNNILRQ